jgi:hypothetical protein
LCLSLLQHKIGPDKAIVGIGPSEQMLAVAPTAWPPTAVGARRK